MMMLGTMMTTTVMPSACTTVDNGNGWEWSAKSNTIEDKERPNGECPNGERPHREEMEEDVANR